MEPNGNFCSICGQPLDGTRVKLCRKRECFVESSRRYSVAYKRTHPQPKADRFSSLRGDKRASGSFQGVTFTVVPFAVDRLQKLVEPQIVRLWARWRVGLVQFVRDEPESVWY